MARCTRSLLTRDQPVPRLPGANHSIERSASIARGLLHPPVEVRAPRRRCASPRQHLAVAEEVAGRAVVGEQRRLHHAGCAFRDGPGAHPLATVKGGGEARAHRVDEHADG